LRVEVQHEVLAHCDNSVPHEQTFSAVIVFKELIIVSMWQFPSGHVPPRRCRRREEEKGEEAGGGHMRLKVCTQSFAQEKY